MFAAAPEVPGPAASRVQLLDLAAFPKVPIDREALEWIEAGPGLLLHVHSEDTARGLKRCIVRGAAGARTVRHGHAGDEVIFVVEGRLRDHRGEYGPGDLCRSRPGDVHHEEVVGDDECLCYVLYYGDLIPLA